MLLAEFILKEIINKYSFYSNPIGHFLLQNCFDNDNYSKEFIRKYNVSIK
jgi:hypothetical protein